MSRAVAWVRDVTPGHNPAQVDRNNHVLPFDPAAADPFLMLMEDWFSDKGFHWHPHRGFETVTLVLDGRLEHKDNLGNQGVLDAGDLQWTTTGKGIIHAELAHRQEGVHTLQLWLNLPPEKKMVEPAYQDLRQASAPTFSGTHSRGRVFAGTVGTTTGPARTITPCGVVDIRLDAGGTFPYEAPADHAAFLYVVSGKIRCGSQGTHVHGGQVAWSKAGQDAAAWPLEADEQSHVVAYHGKPIGAPVAAHGPFVMNTEQELVQAVRDLQQGAFGPVPE